MTRPSDTIHLTPSQLQVLEMGRTICRDERRPFSFKDSDLNHGTFRNCIRILMKHGLAERYDLSSLAFYWITGIPEPASAVTAPPMVGTDLVDLLARIRVGDRAVHDLRLRFTAKGIYQTVPTEICRRNPTSGDLTLAPLDIGLRRGRIILHVTDTVSVILGCSLDPFPLTIAGFGELAAFLGALRIRLVEECRSPTVKVPDVTSWTLVHWHYGRDGRNEVAGPRFSVTVGGLGEGMLRAYTKRLSGKQTLRIELAEVPMQGLGELFAERLEMSDEANPYSKEEKP